ncbi:MAG: hypothetical protein ACPGJX_14405 [Alloalcanivorax venustensis]|uniref:hypothetical protein n=1 Tax=Alloalcanivorax venustensis TaxID=172371 RepID=UPI003C58083E
MDDIQNKKTGNQYRYIYRKEACRFWWCALPYVDEKGRKRQFRKCFRDNRYHNKRAALEAAVAWRDAQMRALKRQGTLGTPPRLRRVAVNELNTLKAWDNSFGIIGITVTRRQKPKGINVSVTAQRGQKKWFSMRRHGAFEAFRLGVRQRCEWIQVPVPSDEELRRRFQHWLKNNLRCLQEYDIAVNDPGDAPIAAHRCRYAG